MVQRRTNTKIGNGASTSNLIADSFSMVIDAQVTGLQLWNVLLVELRGFDVVTSVKHDLYPYGFSGVVLLSDGHIAAQYGIADGAGELNILICSNSGTSNHEQLRSRLWVAFDEITP